MPAAMEMIECERQRMRLSKAGCARLWRSAQERKPEPWEGRAHCRTCPIGAACAGVAAAPAATAAAAEKLRPTCGRCGKVSDRFIHARGICISCYNREREARIGRNRRGNAPAITAKLAPLSMVLTTTEGARLRDFGLCTGPEEAIFTAAKAATCLTGFAPPPIRPHRPGCQLEFGL